MLKYVNKSFIHKSFNVTLSNCHKKEPKIFEKSKMAISLKL